MLYKFLSQRGLSIAFGVGILGTLLFLAFAFSGDTSNLNADTFTGKSPSEVSEMLNNITSFNFGFYITYALFFITVIAAIVLPLVYTATNPSKSTWIGLGGVVILFVLLGIGYLMSANEVDGYGVRKAMQEFSVTDSESKMISAWINGTIILVILTMLSLIVSEIINTFK